MDVELLFIVFISLQQCLAMCISAFNNFLNVGLMHLRVHR
jgi:hypothetical protein